MERKKLMDLYSDFLTGSPNVASAVVFSKVINELYSHDAITRMLAQPELDQKAYWHSIKKVIRQAETATGVIAVDDFIEHKPHSSENSLISYHFDHVSGQAKKGINIVSFTYVNREVAPKIKLPIAFELVRKDTVVTKMVKDKRSGKFKEKTTRQASLGKNELLRSRLKILTHQNNVKYSHVTFDSWYASAENINFIVQDLQKQVVCALKDNRGISFDLDDRSDKKRQWVAVSKANIEPNSPIKIRLKKVPFELILIKRVFHNMNGTVGVQYLVGSDTDLDHTSINTIYKDRWSSEDVHRSLKQNTALEKMPAKLERSQANHIFASMIALVKLECMKLATKHNHYTLKRTILAKALNEAWLQIQKLKERCLEKSIYLPNFSTA